MKKITKLSFLVIAMMLTTTMAMAQGKSKYKCMIQMNSYMGEGAYVAISLVDKSGTYQKTMFVLGADKKWYKSLKEWNKFYKSQKVNLTAVTGASISGGDRSVKVFEIDNDKIDKGYTLRFESAVEDNDYHVKDVEVPLTSAALTGKTDGTGYIKYVRFSKV